MSTNTNGSAASSSGTDVTGQLINGLASGVASGVTTAVTGSALNALNGVIASGYELHNYERNLEKNSQSLENELVKLCARRDDVLAKTNIDRMKQANKECRLWIDSACKLETEIRTLIAKCQPFPSGFWSRVDFSRRLADKVDVVHKCWEDGNAFAMEIMVERPPERVIKVKAPKIDDKPSLYGVVEDTLRFLKDKDIKRIGLWGMVGVGKTAIMQNLNNDEQIAKMFEIVIFATLAGEGNDEELQSAAVKFQHAKDRLLLEIAERLKVNIGDITNTRRIASRISEELKSKRYLLLLDDVWDTFDLEDIGISETDTDGKVVLASQHKDVCAEMCDEIVSMVLLSTADARKLFQEKLGQRKNLAEFGPIAELVLRECCNLPLLIDRVARTFKKKLKIRQWKDGLENLRKWPNVKIQGVDEVLDFLRFCYEELDDEDKKVCFLYGALYSEGYEICEDYLLECWRAEGFTARHSGQDILVDLINVSLLESCEKMKHVRMNKILRNLALKISSEREDSQCLIRANEELEEPPEEEEWKQKRRISLMGNKLRKLPDRLACDSLSTLLLQGNGDLTLIPELFFDSMQSLRVLDLRGTNITNLPASLSCLRCLRALYLNSCKQVMELPSTIDALEHLEVLDIRGTGISFLPIQIGRLHRLKCLRISFSNDNRKTSKVELCHNVISKLLLLEELVIDVHPENQWWKDAVKAVAEEAAGLTNLTSFSFCFPHADGLEIFIEKSSMWKDFCFSFQFSIGHYPSMRYKTLDYAEYEICRCLKYANGEAVDRVIPGVLAEANAFELIGHKGPLKLSDFGTDRIEKLRSCLIEGCEEMTAVIDGTVSQNAVLQNLEKMYISNLQNLGRIWVGPVTAGSLAKLISLVLSKCHNLRQVFCRGMIQQLSKLQHLEVEECHEIEEIVLETEINVQQPGSLPSLTTIVLHDLPKLRSIWIENSMKCPSLKQTRITMCPLVSFYPF